MVYNFIIIIHFIEVETPLNQGQMRNYLIIVKTNDQSITYSKFKYFVHKKLFITLPFINI